MINHTYLPVRKKNCSEYSPDRCSLEVAAMAPGLNLSPEGKFLGMLVNTVLMRFNVPKDKLEYVKGQVEACMHTAVVSARELASVAGTLLSLKDAVHMAPLDTRSLFRAMGGMVSWCANMPEFDRQFAQEDLQYWADNLERLNGKSLVQAHPP